MHACFLDPKKVKPQSYKGCLVLRNPALDIQGPITTEPNEYERSALHDPELSTKPPFFCLTQAWFVWIFSGLIDQLLWLKVNWYEESLRNFKQTLYACYSLAYEYINTTNTLVFNKNAQPKQTQQQTNQPIHEYCIDPFQIVWFKRLHKFYAESYLDKFQLARNLFSGTSTTNQR